MTTLVARQPLQTLHMSSVQRGPRRLSARLQDKEDVPPRPDGGSKGQNRPEPALNNGTKRKNDYEEDDDGFAFSRVKRPKPRASISRQSPLRELQPVEKPLVDRKHAEKKAQVRDDGVAEPPKKRKPRMSFSTPGAPTQNAVRRSKRLSNEQDDRDGSPKQRVRKQGDDQNHTRDGRGTQIEDDKRLQEKKQAKPPPTEFSTLVALPSDDHQATKISLPFADTPVIRRNKAMREGKVGKGERRSSLGFRGRRASSLIETGSSNALPHDEVDVLEFHKHIECEGLPEPRRMRQLLTWCATRALGEKRSGTEFEDQSARLAAGVIQEEILQDLSNRSEMSDWFGREEPAKPAIPLRTRPHPKNLQNAAKITELQEQIDRLRADRDSLQSLLKPPSIPAMQNLPSIARLRPDSIDPDLLSSDDAEMLHALHASTTASRDVSNRLNTIASSLQPTIDAFTSGVHHIGQYRTAADNVACRVLAICAEKLSVREENDKRRALLGHDPVSRGAQVDGVLRSLSRIER